MTNKSPFELRADVLKQAQELLEAQYEANVKLATDFYFAAVKEGFETVESVKKFIPEYPTAEEVLNKANEFYKFVNTGLVK